MAVPSRVLIVRLIAALSLGLVTSRDAMALADEPLPSGIRVREFIYESAPFPQCHASTLVETPLGLVAAWFGGTKEKHPDVGIWVSRQIDGNWTAPVEVANGVESAEVRYPCWNPVLFQYPAGPLMLYYKVGPSPDTWWGVVKTSTDSGITWSAAEKLPDGIWGPVKNKPILLADGTLVSGTSSEDQGWRVFIQRTSDQGKTWTSSGPLNNPEQFGAIQPCFLQLGPQHLQILCRSQQHVITTSTSRDGGRTWGPMQATSLPNPNSGCDAVTLKDGRHVLIYNHTAKGRSPLNLAVSKDGIHWDAVCVLESEPGEYSYPAIIQTEDGLVHVSYTWKRVRVSHLVLDPADWKPQPIRDGAWPVAE